jgi:hypothetical protein
VNEGSDARLLLQTWGIGHEHDNEHDWKIRKARRE